MMSRKQPQHTASYWTGGNTLSWVIGVTLGLLLGLIVLIAVPRTLGGSATAAPAADSAASTPAAPTATADAAKTDTATTDSAKADTATTDSAKADTAPTDSAKADTATAAGDGDAAAGKTKFAGTCAGCHGANAEGGVGPALKIANAWTLEQFAGAVREGKAPEKTLTAMMPHFTTDQVSDADLANLHAYVKTLQ